jgi:uncharacterized cupredoxin-like copper-binding protein
MRLNKTVLAIGWSMALASCSPAAPVSPSQVTSASAPASASPTAGTAGLAATTAPADVAPSGAITVAMSSFKFDPSAITATSGTVTFFLQNVGAGIDPAAHQLHNLAIGVDQDHPLAESGYVAAGKAAVFTVQDLAAGTYMIWCMVPNHAANGMVGTLTVSP